jgi:hypothetical protein
VARDQLSAGHGCGRLATDDASSTSLGVLLGDLAGEAATHGPWAEQQQIVVVGQSGGDRIDEASEVLESVRLTGRLRRAATAVSDAGVVSDMAGRSVMGWHIGVDAGRSRRPIDPPYDDGLPSVDPDERERGRSCMHGTRLLQRL